MAIEISQEDTDIIKEVTNMGMEHASTALYQLLNRRVKVMLPKLDIVNKKDSFNYFDSNEILIGLHLRILEDLNGTLLFLFKKKDMHALVDVLDQKKVGTTNILNEMEISTVKEIANILAGAYLNALGDFSGLKLIPSLPHVTLDTAASILDFVTSPIDDTKCDLLIVRSKLMIEDKDFSIDGKLVVVLEDSELHKLIDKLKEKYK